MQKNHPCLSSSKEVAVITLGVTLDTVLSISSTEHSKSPTVSHLIDEKIETSRRWATSWQIISPRKRMNTHSESKTHTCNVCNSLLPSEGLGNLA
jgi:RNase P subunit RPR2